MSCKNVGCTFIYSKIKLSSALEVSEATDKIKFHSHSPFFFRVNVEIVETRSDHHRVYVSRLLRGNLNDLNGLNPQPNTRDSAEDFLKIKRTLCLVLLVRSR
jgi:hypothetical protein